ncbi:MULTISPECIES: thiamine pyrophosphate-dependent enzyme [unclassified Streptomyces]|uniref:thiamine pyrophosphate-dependent enzyme n=1 Tax=unclassified Streptomyces TaxID=2593676 RepID=UPI0009A12224|nr:thiamine pyrophosphate-dependent enzyme [Streptomyces sp. TSRI0281]
MAARRGRPAARPGPLLPDRSPVRIIGTPRAAAVRPALARSLHRRLVVGRGFNEQASTSARQGRLAVYPSSTGQEACQVAAASALRSTDWLFPTYRGTLAVHLRGTPADETLALLHGAVHSGYDPWRWRTAPLCTPLATHLPHAVGLAHAARLRGDDMVALSLAGDGATSEGDFHEALTFAGVLRAPVVFLVQNNGCAISVPLARHEATANAAGEAADRTAAELRAAFTVPQHAAPEALFAHIYARPTPQLRAQVAALHARESAADRWDGAAHGCSAGAAGADVHAPEGGVST